MSTVQSNQRIKTFVETDRISYYRRYLMVLNCILPEDRYLNTNEISLLSVVISLEDNVHKYNRFNTAARKIVRQKLKFSLSTITNTITSLKEKRAIYEDKDTGILTIHPSLMVDIPAFSITAVIRYEQPQQFVAIDNTELEQLEENEVQ